MALCSRHKFYSGKSGNEKFCAPFLGTSQVNIGDPMPVSGVGSAMMGILCHYGMSTVASAIFVPFLSLLCRSRIVCLLCVTLQPIALLCWSYLPSMNGAFFPCGEPTNYGKYLILPLPRICLLLKLLVMLFSAMIYYTIPRFNLSSVSRMSLASSHLLFSTLQHSTSHQTIPSRPIPNPPHSRIARTYLLANAFSQVGKQTRYTAREEQTKQNASPADWPLLRTSSPSAGIGGLMARYKKMW